MLVEIINLENHSSLQKEAADWFASKWEIDASIYLESIMTEGVAPSWFVAVSDENNKISGEYFDSQILVDLMKHLDVDRKRELVLHRNLSSILSPLEIESLRREI